MTPTQIPQKQYAVQLVGPGKLVLNKAKDVFKPGAHQVLAKIECVGLCFSDLKLLKQFSGHVRKSAITGGLTPAVLAEIPSYVPGDQPTVPGHEVTCRIVAVGNDVKHHKIGERCLIQADFRGLPTAGSNAAFGYNFEGALQEYVLLDERVIIDSQTGERFLIPVPENLGASAIALVEPWACVEDSYANIERQTLKPGGRLLIVTEMETDAHLISDAALSKLYGKGAPGTVKKMRSITGAPALADLPNEGFDDIIYYGSNKAIIEILNDKLATGAMINIVQCGKKVGQLVSVGIGRVHYGMTRWIGTAGLDAADAYNNIPATGELRAGDSAVIIGAGGPMGQMHVIRSLCAGLANLTVVGTDVDDPRLAALAAKSEALAKANHVTLRLVNTQKHPLNESFSYWALMAPVGALVAAAVKGSVPGTLINIFAGIPGPTRQDLDLDLYIANRCYMFGTSGSLIRDMIIVLDKVKANTLDTNASVDAVSGMAGATDGIAAVENRTLAGKIIVYPMLYNLGLTPLHELPAKYPTVAAKLDHGKWTKEAEQELLRVAK